MKILSLFAMVWLIACVNATSQNYISKVWVADNGDGTYKNPVLHADYSDPDAIRVGDDYYMVSSSFNCIPALQILHSKDLVNWTIIGSAAQKLIPEELFSTTQHGNGVWAPSIRYHQNEFFIYYGDPDQGVFMTRSKNIRGPWEPLVLVKRGKGLIDTTPLWDDDGRVYLVHGFAGSRAGFKSVLAICELSADGSRAISDDVLIFDGHENHPTVEGPKFYKRNGYYYIFAPAGGVATGWQLVLRSKNVYGPYDEKVVLAQGKTAINGPHQGAWVDTKNGEDWFLHFQDVGNYGRLVHLQPMRWVNDWPVIGSDKDGDGTGEPVLKHKKPNVGATYPICTPQESDEFEGYSLGLQWQWHANPNPLWSYFAGHKGYMRLYSVPVPKDFISLWDLPNLLLQKMPAAEFTATTRLTFKPNPNLDGERAGLVVMGRDYAMLSIEDTPQGLVLSQIECLKADRKGTETVNATINLKEDTFYLRVKVAKGGVCSFSYSLDGKKFLSLGNNFTAKEGMWIGAKTGLFVSRPVSNNDGGWMDVDWFRIEK